VRVEGIERGGARLAAAQQRPHGGGGEGGHNGRVRGGCRSAAIPASAEDAQRPRPGPNRNACVAARDVGAIIRMA
jgi:hypothetical protein